MCDVYVRTATIQPAGVAFPRDKTFTAYLVWLPMLKSEPSIFYTTVKYYLKTTVAYRQSHKTISHKNSSFPCEFIYTPYSLLLPDLLLGF